ncbi:MAG: Na+/H+ antiporter subunit E [Pseudomonadota bacterium]|nr:Na+/H+ antiporter subunit E [Pseudomonadota bacterium]
MRYASAVALLFGFWILLSGYFTPFLLGAGLASAIAVVLFARRMAVIGGEGYPLHLGRGAITYWPWLLKEIVKSAWDVARIILHPRLPISPAWVRVRHSQKTLMGRVTHANSITLTPGTITVEAEGDEFLVHALTRAGVDALAEGEMDRRVSRFEGTR